MIHKSEDAHIQAGVNATIVAYERARDRISGNTGGYHSIDSSGLAIPDFKNESPNAFATFDPSGMSWIFVSLKLIREILGLDSTEGQRLGPLTGVLIHEMVHAASRVDVFFMISYIQNAILAGMVFSSLIALPVVFWPIAFAILAISVGTVRSLIKNYAELEADAVSGYYENPTFLPTILSQINRYSDSEEEEALRNRMGCGMLLFGDHPTVRFRKAQSRLSYLHSNDTPFILRVFRPNSEANMSEKEEKERDNSIIKRIMEEDLEIIK